MEHLREALRVCGYPSWALNKVTDSCKKKKNKKKTNDRNYRSQVVIPYVEGVSERVHRVLKKYGVATTMRPHTTLRRLLVHPNDKVELEEQDELVYQIPCKNCGAEYIGETGRLLKSRLEEHRKDVDNTKKEKYTRSGKKRLMSTINKSALTDHATTENHIIESGTSKKPSGSEKPQHPSTETRAIMNCLTCTMTSSSVIGTDEINVTR